MTTNANILLVDDAVGNLALLSKILDKHSYYVRCVPNGELALQAVSLDAPDLILLDIMLPGINGLEVCQILKKNERTRDIPIIFLSALDTAETKERCFEIGGFDYISKPFQELELMARVQSALGFHRLHGLEAKYREELEYRVEERTSELKKLHVDLIRSLGAAAEYRDTETGAHIIRVSHYSRILALKIGLEPEHANHIFQASPLHDLGKIGIPDSILLKNGKLTKSEWEIMKTHCEIGGEILSNHTSKVMVLARIIAETHHEKWDGSGYPNGLKSGEIPIEGLIVALCDVFDALGSPRPYKEAWPIEQIIDYIDENSGKHFSPILVRHFTEILPEILEFRELYSNK